LKHIIDDKDLLEWFVKWSNKASTSSYEDIVNDFLQDKPKAYGITVEHRYVTDLMLNNINNSKQLEYLVKHKLVEELTEKIFNELTISTFTDPLRQELVFCINLDIVKKGK